MNRNQVVTCSKHGQLLKIPLKLPQDERNHAIRAHMTAHVRAYPDCLEKMRVQSDKESA